MCGRRSRPQLKLYEIFTSFKRTPPLVKQFAENCENEEGPNGGKGVPVKYTLTPIQTIQEVAGWAIVDKVLKKVGESLMETFEEVSEELVKVDGLLALYLSKMNQFPKVTTQETINKLEVSL